jgi:4-aminobutyrate aminotransferase-like enzyme
MIDNKEWD